MRELSDVHDVRRAIATRRVMDDRDDDYTTRASALYEQLRTLTYDALIARHPFPDIAADAPRQVVIADIIEHEEMPPMTDLGYSARCPLCGAEHDYATRADMESDWNAWNEDQRRDLATLRDMLERLGDSLPSKSVDDALAAVGRIASSLGIASVGIR